MNRTLYSGLLLLVLAVSISGQSTQSVISGQVADSEDGRALAGAQISYWNLGLNLSGSVETDAFGYYVAPLLSAGKYRVRVSKDSYQSQELYEIELLVASWLDLNFRLRPLSDVWEQGQYQSVFLPGTSAALPLYGPDVDTSHVLLLNSNSGRLDTFETSISTVVDPGEISELPLAGRDVYATLMLQPGVTADSGTARGLGFSVNGQRPSSSNYLLDGAENNNYLTTGPLTAVAPEAVQEYRVSTNNFSAEYGRTSGFIANAVTRAGGSRWHGLAYFYFRNDVLDAADFQQNAKAQRRSPLKEAQPGFVVGGPIIPSRLFVSAAFEYYRYRGRLDPQVIRLPTTHFLSYCQSVLGACGPNSQARRLLESYPAPPVTDGNNPTALVTMSPTSSLNRYFVTPRLDYVSRGGAHRLMSRLALARYDQPDAAWSPYRDFLSPLTQNFSGLVVNAVSSLRPGITNEARVAWNASGVRYDRPHPEIPTLAAGDVVLPGSRAIFSLSDQSRGWEFVDNLGWSTGRHAMKFGGGVYLRDLNGYLTMASTPTFSFSDINQFGLDAPGSFYVAVSRQKLFDSATGPLDLAVPDSGRTYRFGQLFAFAQDSFKVNHRVAVNYGARYEYFGAPVNIGPVKDGIVQLGPGDGLPQRLGSAAIVFPHRGDQQLYSPDKGNLGMRFGASFAIRDDSRLVARASYGIFYDPPFDNLWENIRNNNVILTLQPLAGSATDYLGSVSDLLAPLRNQPASAIDNTQFIHDTLYQPGFRTAYTQSYFVGLQGRISESLAAEVDAVGSLGRELVTTDLLNRVQSLPLGQDPKNLLGFLNPALPLIAYRANQGSSNYNSLQAVLRYRGARGQLQAAYTWSHSIDNQSEPLTGEFDFTQLNLGGAGLSGLAAFSRQFDSRGDRGNSDFDQRHNLVFYSIWSVPVLFARSPTGVLFRTWRVSQVAAFRTGFPYTVNAPSLFSLAGESIANNRADVVMPSQTRTDRDVASGRLLLNAAAFQVPAPGTLGNSGRNAFTGPGLFNVDLSISRSIAVPRLGERSRLVLRADAFNVLNHANLNNPTADLSQPGSFGVAYYGRQERNTGFPLLVPFRETARQVQLLLRVEF
jgi:hypothetical protein